MSFSLEKLNERTQSLLTRVKSYVKEPWKYEHEPFHVIDNIYFVGTSYVSCFLIDTKSGLILIDTGFPQTAYQLVNSILKLGFNARDIRLLLISHAHFDHCGGARVIQEISGCETYLDRNDMFFLDERRDLMMGEDDVPEFSVQHNYNDDVPISLGNTVIRTVHTPGHTPGTTSFFIDVKYNDKSYTCAMHGGLGLNGLSLTELRGNRLPEKTQQVFVNSLREMIKRDVDIVLPSHNHYCPAFLDIADAGNKTDQYIDKTRWPAMLQSSLDQMLELIESKI